MDFDRVSARGFSRAGNEVAWQPPQEIGAGVATWVGQIVNRPKIETADLSDAGQPKKGKRAISTIGVVRMAAHANAIAPKNLSAAVREASYIVPLLVPVACWEQEEKLSVIAITHGPTKWRAHPVGARSEKAGWRRQS